MGLLKLRNPKNSLRLDIVMCRLPNWLVLLACLCCPAIIEAREPSTQLAIDQGKALESAPDAAAAAARVLADFHARSDGEGGFAWWMRLPISVRSRLAASAPVLRWRNRVEFLRDAERSDAAACAQSGVRVLRDPELSCDFLMELRRYLDCIDDSPDPVREPRILAIRDLATARLEQEDLSCKAPPQLVTELRARLDSARASVPQP